MNKFTPSKGASSNLWIKDKSLDPPKVFNLLVKQHPNSNDPEIDRSLYFLGRALYRYSLLQKEGSDNES